MPDMKKEGQPSRKSKESNGFPLVPETISVQLVTAYDKKPDIIF